MDFFITLNCLSRRIRLVRITAIHDGIARGRGSYLLLFCLFLNGIRSFCVESGLFPSRSDVNGSHFIIIMKYDVFQAIVLFFAKLFSFELQMFREHIVETINTNQKPNYYVHIHRPYNYFFSSRSVNTSDRSLFSGQTIFPFSLFNYFFFPHSKLSSVLFLLSFFSLCLSLPIKPKYRYKYNYQIPKSPSSCLCRLNRPSLSFCVFFV